jgi:hypothetical protein
MKEKQPPQGRGYRGRAAIALGLSVGLLMGVTNGGEKILNAIDDNDKGVSVTLEQELRGALLEANLLDARLMTPAEVKEQHAGAFRYKPPFKVGYIALDTVVRPNPAQEHDGGPTYYRGRLGGVGGMSSGYWATATVVEGEKRTSHPREALMGLNDDGKPVLMPDMEHYPEGKVETREYAIKTGVYGVDPGDKNKGLQLEYYLGTVEVTGTKNKIIDVQLMPDQTNNPAPFMQEVNLDSR